MVPVPEQTGVDARSGRLVRSIGNLETGESAGVAGRFAEPARGRHAGETSPGGPDSNREEEATARDTPLGNRQVQVVRWPSNINPNKLTPEALARLTAISRSATGAHQAPVHNLRHDEVLQNLRVDVQQEFLRERAAARSLVEDLELDEAAEIAIKELVIHDDIPVSLVPPLANAYLQIKDELGALSRPQAGPELQTTMRAIRNAMTRAFDDAGLELNSDNRHRACKMFWRFVLAPGQSEQARGIVDQLNRPGSPLRALGEGATWYRKECHRQQAASQSPGAEQRPHPAVQQPRRAAQHLSRVSPQAPALPHPRSVRTSSASRNSLAIATDYSLLVRSLAEVLYETTGRHSSGLAIEGTADVPDQAIATLRNLGVPMPAPRRLGGQNRDTPISESGLAAIRGQLAEHMRIKGFGPFVRGVSAECIDDVRNNTYMINGISIPVDYESVSRAIVAFCSSPEGTVNRPLIRNLSMLAYSGGFDCVRHTCLNNRKPEIALFSEDPVLTKVQQTHGLRRDATGNVILDCRQVGNVQQVRTRTADDSLETIDLDPNHSFLDLNVRFLLDRATGQPTLGGVSVDYAFIPAARTPADSASMDGTLTGLTSSLDTDGADEAESGQDSD